MTSTTKTDFEQMSFGTYVAYRRGPLTADVQFRFDDTDFEITDVARPGFRSLGLSDSDLDSETFTVSGRLNYTIEMEQGMVFVPTVGFSRSRTRLGDLAFEGGEILRIEDYRTNLGFVGGTLAKTMVSPSGTSATTLFTGANYYNDFADDRESIFYDSSMNTETITSSNLGAFGELSVGMNYVSVLNGGSASASQFNASVRVDTRFGDDIDDSYGLTGQLRLTF